MSENYLDDYGELDLDGSVDFDTMFNMSLDHSSQNNTRQDYDTANRFSSVTRAANQNLTPTSELAKIEICKMTRQIPLSVGTFGKDLQVPHSQREVRDKNINLFLWSIADYHGMIEIKFRLVSHRFFFKTVLFSKSLFLSDLMDSQSTRKSFVQFSHDFSLPIPIRQKKKKSYFSNPFKSPSPLSTSSSRTSSITWFSSSIFGEKSPVSMKSDPLLYQEKATKSSFLSHNSKPTASEKSNIVKINFSFRIIHSGKLLQLNNEPTPSLIPCQSNLQFQFQFQSPTTTNNAIDVNTRMSELHFLCSCAPSALVVEIMKSLAEVKLLPTCLQLRTEGGNVSLTALDIALLSGNSPVVYDILRRAGSSCFQKLPQNTANALHNAVQGGSIVCLTYVCKYITEAHSKFREGSAYMRGTPSLTALFEWKDGQGKTPLALACSLPGRDPMVELLLQYKAEVSAVNPVDGFTPLMYACLLGDVRTVNRLLAVSKKREAINGDAVPHVLSLYASDPSAKEKALDRQAIHLAAEKGFTDIVERLLSVGVSILATDRNEDSIFHIAAKCGHTQLFVKMASIEADQWRKYQKSIESAESPSYRRKAMASMNLHGKYPVELAAESGHADLAALILQHVQFAYQIDHMLSSANKRTCGQLARGKINTIRNRHSKIRELLLNEEKADSDHESSSQEKKSDERKGRKDCMDVENDKDDRDEQSLDDELLPLFDDEGDEQDYRFALSHLSLMKYAPGEKQGYADGFYRTVSQEEGEEREKERERERDGGEGKGKEDKYSRIGNERNRALLSDGKEEDVLLEEK